MISIATLALPRVLSTAQIAGPTLEIKNHSISKNIETPKLSKYIQIVDSCGPEFGDCATSHTGPGASYPIIKQLRTGVILKIDKLVTGDDKSVWYKVIFDEWLRYPERVPTEWYVASENVRMFENGGIEDLEEQSATTTKYILVDRSDQKLYAYEDDQIFMSETISTGIELTPTPRGTFTIYRKTPTRYMQGPLPGISSKYYDLPGVPWNLYFTKQGGVIHGTYWHNQFGRKWSNGCVNVPTDQAEKLYIWADIGTTVIVQD